MAVSRFLQQHSKFISILEGGYASLKPPSAQPRQVRTAFPPQYFRGLFGWVGGSDKPGTNCAAIKLDGLYLTSTDKAFYLAETFASGVFKICFHCTYKVSTVPVTVAVLVNS